MSNDLAISVANISKMYRIFDKPEDRLKDGLLWRWGKRYGREFWALKDISFEVKKGESVGIIGRNGSGKSTLLQIIAGTLQPTSGSVQVNGRVAALLELGSGFNPDYTGRENVYMNAAILGLTKEETDAKFDAIASFADIGQFLDQPVKTYSSGMVVRLAFSVQTMIEPDILIVDEALAVGDSLFQKRCFQKMEKLLSDGTTLLFVSHDQESVRTLTAKAILLKGGLSKCQGTPSEVILEYRKELHDDEKAYFASLSKDLQTKAGSDDAVSKRSDNLSFGDADARITAVTILDENNEGKNVFYPGETQRFAITCQTYKTMSNLNVGIRLRNREGVKMYSWGTLNQDISIWSGRHKGTTLWDQTFDAGAVFTVLLEGPCYLGPNFYELQVYIAHDPDRYFGAHRLLHWRDEAAFFTVVISLRNYFFGGVCDLRMNARWTLNA